MFLREFLNFSTRLTGEGHQKKENETENESDVCDNLGDSYSRQISCNELNKSVLGTGDHASTAGGTDAGYHETLPEGWSDGLFELNGQGDVQGDSEVIILGILDEMFDTCDKEERISDECDFKKPDVGSGDYANSDIEDEKWVSSEKGEIVPTGWKGSECENDLYNEQDMKTVPTPSRKIREKNIKEKVKNTTAQANFIINLFGLSAWWDRVCRHEKKEKVQTTKPNPTQSNQKAKVDFLTNYSPLRVARQTLKEREKSTNPTDLNLKGSTTPKRLREDDNLSTGGSPIIMQRMTFEDQINFYNGGIQQLPA